MIFVDTSFWFALQAGADSRHPDATALWQTRSAQLITTDLILGETWTLLSLRKGRDAAVKFVQAVRADRAVDVQLVTEVTTANAWTWLMQHDERMYSFVDATSFILMRQLEITDALAFDGDFSAAGFTELRP